MSEDGEIWEAIHKDAQAKRWKNNETSLALLTAMGIPYRTLNKSVGHYRVGSYDFWPNTGRWYDQKTKVNGRGVKNLILQLKNGK